MSEHLETMKRLQKACDGAIERAYGTRRDIPGAVNWADLHCLDVEWYETLYGDSGYRVIVEEAAPENPDFQKFIREDIQKFGFDVEVVTEW